MNRTAVTVVLIDEGQTSCTPHEPRVVPRARQEQKP
jgi:hypothetical protein